MAHEWHAGVLSSSSWHGLEEVGVMADADGAIGAGERTGAWPVALDSESVKSDSGLVCPDTRAIVANYADASRRVVGVVGNRYNATTPDGWRSLVKAACLAGGKPIGAFALRDGSRVLATFDLNGVGTSGIRTQLVVADAFDGSMKLTCGFTSVRVVCANTLAVALKQDGAGMAALRHTASLEEKVKVLAGAIGDSVQQGSRVRDLYARAESTQLDRTQAQAVFDALFPSAAKDASKAAITRAENVRAEARKAATLPVNAAGGGTLATLWNAATWIVDRKADGSARDTRSGEALDSMLFGPRAERVNEIQTLIEVLLRDGTRELMTASDAIASGVDKQQVGAKILEEILAGN